MVKVDPAADYCHRRVQRGEKPSAKETRDESQRSVESQPVSEDGPSDFLLHAQSTRDLADKN